jgi:hypothetical protein
MPWGTLGHFSHDPFFFKKADAGQAKSSGAMVALYPRTDEALQMAIPGGEAPQELHVTLAYLGEDVTDLGDPGNLSRALDQVANTFTVITARVMGHATFNPDGGDPEDEREQDQCAVYLVSDNDQLPDLHSAVLDAVNQEFSIPTQHLPWLPHITAGYGIPASELTFTGQVLFDRIGLAWAGRYHFYPLLGSTVGEYETGN